MIKQLSMFFFVHMHFSNMWRRSDHLMERSKMAACFTSQLTCFEALLFFVLLHYFFCTSSSFELGLADGEDPPPNTHTAPGLQCVCHLCLAVRLPDHTFHQKCHFASYSKRQEVMKATKAHVLESEVDFLLSAKYMFDLISCNCKLV